MSFFKKLKKDIGIEEEEKSKVKLKKEVLKEKVEEKPKKIPVSAPKKKASDWLKTEGQLAVDVFQTNSEFCVRAPIAGVKPENIDVSVENEMLVIKGERKEVEEEVGKNYFYQECYWGSFSRQIILPEDVDTSRIKASLSKGILTVRIPRVKRIKKKKVAVQTEE